VSVCLFVCVSRAWPSAWAWHRACPAAPQALCLAPQAPCPTAYHCRADSKQFARNCTNSTWRKLFGRPFAESCRAKRRQTRAVIGRKGHFRRLSHSVFETARGAAWTNSDVGARLAPHRARPACRLQVAPSPLPYLTVLSNTGVWVPPVGTSARRGATPPSGGPSMVLCGAHTRT